MRQSVSAWPQIRYEPVTDAGGELADRNAVRRAGVLWALQYDRRPEDLPLLRLLVEQEARCRRDAPFQGLGDAAELAGHLLSEHRDVSDVWLHWEMKRANFDTWCGYDREHLLAAGVADTIAFVRDADHPDRADVLAALVDERGEPRVTEAELDEWFAGKRERFPEDPAQEDPLTWIDRARLAGDREQARRMLDRWASERAGDPSTKSLLRHLLEELGDFAAAAWAQRDLLSVTVKPFDKAGAWLKLAELEREAGDHDAAWQALRECRNTLVHVSDWQEYGLGRSYIEELFRLAAVAAEPLARSVFAEAVQVAPTVPRLPLVAFQAAAGAAERVGDRRHVRHYRAAVDAERRRIAEMKRKTR